MWVSLNSFYFLLIFLVTGVITVNVHKINRRYTQLKRSFNHPPAAENYDYIPVSVVYDKEEEPVRGKDLKEIGTSKEEDITHLKSIAKQETQSVHPLLAGNNSEISVSIPLDSELESEKFLNPKADNTKTFSDLSLIQNGGITKKMGRVLMQKETNTDNEGLRRRSQQVRRVKLRKNDTDTLNRKNSDQDNTHTNAERRSNNIKMVNKSKRMKDPVIPIIEMENYVFSHSGDFHFSYEGGDGTKASEKGELKTTNGTAGNAVEGSYSYKGKDGTDYMLTYTADENGYRPVGAHLPTPPPIPPAIQRALDYLATKTTPDSDVSTEKIKPLKKY